MVWYLTFSPVGHMIIKRHYTGCHVKQVVWWGVYLYPSITETVTGVLVRNFLKVISLFFSF